MRRHSYVQKFLASSSCEDIVALFSATTRPEKEITESWALLEAAKRYVPDVNDRVVVVVGDGITPRTAALFAYFTRAPQCWSIDPLMRLDAWMRHCANRVRKPERIYPLAMKIAEFIPPSQPLLAVWPHSHARMADFCTDKRDDVVHIAMPCCEPISPAFMRVPHLAYEDERVLSEKRIVHVWRGKTEGV